MQTMTHYDRSPFRLVYENHLMVIPYRSTNSVCTSGFSSNIIALEDKKRITLTLDKSSYATLTNIYGNQLSVSGRSENQWAYENIFFEWNFDTFEVDGDIF